MLGNWSHSVDHLVHLLVAFILALPIGWHRAREEHGAGLRTFPLVAMAACGFVQTGISVLGAGAVTQANILQGVIIGVGFIGAGAIMKEGAVATGHATAASVWVVGIIGAAVGYGYYDIGLILAAANLAVLVIRARFPTRSAAPGDISQVDHRAAS
jgi:putative Mg2+ transporter-C (MgtC) family protein